MARVLLTGFGRFPGAPANPSETIARKLDKFKRVDFRRSQIELTTAILPVVYGDVESVIENLLAEHKPDIVLHMGLAARRKNITLETIARNRLSRIHPDASGLNASHPVIDSDGPTARKARWPVARLTASLNHFGIATACSRDAGDYLCNQSLYLSLKKHDGFCGFVHLPLPRELQRRKAQSFTTTIKPSLAELESAVVWIIRQMAVEHRRGAI